MSITNMNVWGISELQRAALNFSLMIGGNLLWLWQVSAVQDRHEIYSRMIIWNASYTLITFMVPPAFLAVPVDYELIVGCSLLAIGHLIFSNSQRISKFMTHR
jgi:hypothetical protein